MAAPFSRLQLAAALLEYDNDLADPDAPHRSAHESAIFAHLRQNASRAQVAPRRSGHLGVSLPSESGSIGGRESALDTRRSRGSIDALRNPFGADDNLESEDEGENEELEVDLASWGLDAFMPKDKGSRNSKGRANSALLPNPHPVSSVRSHPPFTNDTKVQVLEPRRALGTSRSMSLGGDLDFFGVEKTALRGQSYTYLEANRRRSIGSPLDLASMNISQEPLQRRRALSHTLIQTLPGDALQSVPFPTGSMRSPSPLPNEDSGLGSTSSGMRSRPPDQPDSHRHRAGSNATMGTVLLADDNPFALRPPSRASRFDPKAAAHARTMSNASMGSHILLDTDRVSVATAQVVQPRERRYSTTLDLLRPKVLVMPSPLQPATVSTLPPPGVKLRDGFQLSTDGPPLPPGARSARRASVSLSVAELSPSISAPIASNSFTPNPLMSLSLSQMTFRNTLAVGGQRDTVAPGYEGGLPRATEEGEQVHPEVAMAEEDLRQASQVDKDAFRNSRPPGKLFGKSLIDDLESRKAQMRSKQRVFTGDQRPSMMARGQPQRASTLIDPAALQIRPVSHRLDSYGSQGSQQALGRRNSANVKPLLNFDDDAKVGQPNISPSARMASSRSVFGVDTLWEREMTKLREMEAQDKIDAEERRKQAEGEGKKKKKGKHKDKGKSRALDDDDPVPAEVMTAEAQTKVSMDPPTLPIIKPVLRKPPQVSDNESESDESEAEAPLGGQAVRADPGTWFAESSDDEEAGPKRTTGTGLRYPNKPRQLPLEPAHNDSEEDVPLAATFNRAAERARLRSTQGDSDDEEKPLSTLLQKTKSSLMSINFDNPATPGSTQGGDDDDEPLGLRASRVITQGADDDDRPLAYHPEQQRRTQYHMIAQQQQQQQIMMQAQLQSNMFFNQPPMMGPGFFGPPIPPMMMQPPMPMPSPPPLHDEAKYGRVDRWRRDVAVEGEPQ